MQLSNFAFSCFVAWLGTTSKFLALFGIDTSRCVEQGLAWRVFEVLQNFLLATQILTLQWEFSCFILDLQNSKQGRDTFDCKIDKVCFQQSCARKLHGLHMCTSEFICMLHAPKRGGNTVIDKVPCTDLAASECLHTGNYSIQEGSYYSYACEFVLSRIDRGCKRTNNALCGFVIFGPRSYNEWKWLRVVVCFLNEATLHTHCCKHDWVDTTETALRPKSVSSRPMHVGMAGETNHADKQGESVLLQCKTQTASARFVIY